jgi:hypothetical protein
MEINMDKSVWFLWCAALIILVSHTIEGVL